MKKIKKLVLAALPLTATIGTIATVTSCNKKDTSVQTLNYDDAKEWVKNNYGEQEAYETINPTKTVTSFNFAGELTSRKTTETTSITNYQKYLKSHIAGFVTKLNKGKTATSTTIQSSITFSSTTSTLFTAIASNDIEVEWNDGDVEFYKPLCYNNFESIIGDFFMGATGKKYTEFVVNNTNKTMQVTGTLNCFYTETAGTGYLTMPDFSICFNEKGCVSSYQFNFKKYCEAEYLWLNSTTTEYSDWFDFTINEGGTMKIVYDYNA